MRKAIVVTFALLAASAAAPASAQPIECADFALTQTYRGWGPALHYGKTVTVVYAADECSGSWTDEAFSYEVTGSASIYEGPVPEGKHPAGPAMDVLHFSTKGSFSDAEDAGWPPAWWSCLASADVRWQIAGIYSFRATAEMGDWSLGINVTGATPFRWSYSAC